MKYSCVLPVVLAASAATAFAPTAFAPQRSAPAGASQQASSSALFISSWGKGGPPSRSAGQALEKQSPEDNLQSYLSEPDSVEARNTLDGKALVSGLVQTPERTDQLLFDFCNDAESAFEFEKIVAFVPDVKFAKKRLLSRSARYTGLLDKLEFMEVVEGSTASMPTMEQMQGVKSWVMYIDTPESMVEQVSQAVAVAKESSDLENLAILLANGQGLDLSSCETILEKLKADNGISYTLCAVGKLTDTEEGKIPYKYTEFGTAEGMLPSNATYSRNEAYRLITECLQLECGVNKALTFMEVTDEKEPEFKLVKGLREAGYVRMQEIDHMVRLGPEAYKKAIVDFNEKHPDYKSGVTTTEAWWEDPKFKKQLAELRESQGQTEKDNAIGVVDEGEKDERTLKIEEIATDWAKREYFKQNMDGTVDESMTEEEFIKSVWDRAMFEGDVKYRQMKGETLDAAAELAEFKDRQAKKEETMLARAKAQLSEILAEENLGGEDLDESLSKLEPRSTTD
eukprot:CAMPEP_0119551026 /NCGR_PEP_ID=MMETSP1352-20130426/4418_1 /TAXON_ID=265584 /ORGANISM="Stauroneis constricta, Strain CCMP1120" /LENGTH=511 /DNA_ID=CAMNT_0007597031 /DNA_START=130 /DNA_END=1665 /DNA_ORIENTATION=-